MPKSRYLKYAALISIAIGTIFLFAGALLKINSSSYVATAAFLLGGGCLVVILGIFSGLGLLLRDQLAAKSEPETLDLEGFAKAAKKEPLPLDNSEDMIV